MCSTRCLLAIFLENELPIIIIIIIILLFYLMECIVIAGEVDCSDGVSGVQAVARLQEPGLLGVCDVLHPLRVDPRGAELVVRGGGGCVGL